MFYKCLSDIGFDFWLGKTVASFILSSIMGKNFIIVFPEELRNTTVNLRQDN
jgi:hypothetical protein